MNDQETGTGTEIILIDEDIPTQLKFLRKIYISMEIQFLIILSFFFLSVYFTDYREFLFENGISYIVSWVLTTCIIFGSYYIKKFQKYPINLILLIILNISLGYNLSILGTFHPINMTLGGILVIVFYYLGLIGFTFQSSKNINVNQIFYAAALSLFIYPSCIMFENTSNNPNYVGMVIALGVSMFFCLSSMFSCTLLLNEKDKNSSIINGTISIYTISVRLVSNIINAFQEFCTSKICCK